jgi:NAD(P)-dependent dehydrogenase (short-subunit alcohol dehydrogenase family)
VRTLVIGADGGLGTEVCSQMSRVGDVVPFERDIRQPKHIKNFLSYQQPFNNVVYCAGVNYISKFDDIVEDQFFESMDVNCFGFARLIKQMREQQKLTSYSHACLVTSNAANIAMSHSLSYNCSKAAANMMIRQLGRELRVKDVTVFGVAPNKLRGTGMSLDIEVQVMEMRGWTAVEAAEYQINALPARQETEPKECAHFIMQLMTHHHFTLHGTILPYGGPQQ